jgi:hypothetical protein
LATPTGIGKAASFDKAFEGLALFDERAAIIFSIGIDDPIAWLTKRVTHPIPRIA